MNQELIIFTHIPKAAGSTLVLIIEQEYGKNNIFKIRINDTFEKIQYQLKQHYQKSEKSFFATGHLGFGIHEFLSIPVKYITMLREPVALLTSRYYYRQNHFKSNHPLVVHANKSTLEEFVDAIEDNTMTRFLSGAELQAQISLGKEKSSFDNLQIERVLNKDLREKPCSREMLETAKKNLEYSIDSFGITEHFNESLLLFKKTFNWNRIYYLRQNTGLVKDKATLPQSTLEKIQGRNRYDIELYQFACDLFKKRIQSHGSSFSRELERFEFLNPICGRVSLARHFLLDIPQLTLEQTRRIKKKLF